MGDADPRPRLRPFSLDLAAPLSTARGTVERREGFLVGVEADVGDEPVRGLGEATPLPGWTESFDDCGDALADVPADGWDEHFSARSAPAASHGYQLAVLDVEARDRGVPLADLLVEAYGGADGGVGASANGVRESADSVPVNATVGDGDAEETVDAALGAVASGYRCLKLKVGARALEDDLDRVRAVVDAVGIDPGAGGGDAGADDGTGAGVARDDSAPAGRHGDSAPAIRLDANGAWDRETARRAVDAAADLGVEYVEQPLPADDLDGLADLRGRGVEVAVDESLADGGLRGVLDAGAADVAVLKPMALGGPGATLGAARRLRASGVEPVITTTVDAAVARVAAVHVAAAIPDVRPCGLATGDLLAEDLGPDPVPVSGGTIPVPDGPGNCGDAFDDLVW